jgi:hypothetical protein
MPFGKNWGNSKASLEIGHDIGGIIQHQYTFST